MSEILEVDLLEIKNRNSMTFTAKILGLHINNLPMEQHDKANIEDRLNKIEAHLSTIARTRRKNSKIRGRVMIIAVTLVAAFIIFEVLVEFGIFN